MKLKILFVDDEPEIVDLFILNFASDDVTVVACTDPEEAIREANSQAFDMVFVDFRMPQMSGDEVAKQMPPKIPKYLITGEIAPKFDYPFIEVLQKPFVERRVEMLIAQALSKPKSSS